MSKAIHSTPTTDSPMSLSYSKKRTIPLLWRKIVLRILLTGATANTLLGIPASASLKVSTLLNKNVFLRHLGLWLYLRQSPSSFYYIILCGEYLANKTSSCLINTSGYGREDIGWSFWGFFLPWGSRHGLGIPLLRLPSFMFLSLIVHQLGLSYYQTSTGIFLFSNPLYWY